MEREDGEMSDDNNSMIVDEGDLTHEADPKKITVLFKAEKNGILVQTLEKVDAIKLEERAKRFGLNLTGNRIVTQKQIDELYTNFGIASGNERHFRFDTVHLNGVGGLSAKEIFEYLEDYKPVSLEWIDASSCNIVCQDHISAALALLVHSREIRDEDLKNMIVKTSTHHWREGMPHPKQDFILMRFATNSDKKDSSKKKKHLSEPTCTNQSVDSIGKNPWGDLCQSWGVYDHQEVWLNRKTPIDELEDEEQVYRPRKEVPIRNKSLARRLGKRTREENSEHSDSSTSDSTWTKKQKAPRMRMHADDEESRTNTTKTPQIKEEAEDSFAPLSIEVANIDSSYTPKEFTKLSDKFRSHSGAAIGDQKEGIHSRLGTKVTPADDGSSDAYSDNSNHNVMSRVQLATKAKGSSTVWSRLDVQTEPSSDTTDLRQLLKLRKQVAPVYKRSNDLRDRLGKTSNTTKGVSLRIEIDNDYLNQSD